MESKKEEALLAKHQAEKLFAEKDFVGAKSFALRAQMLFPELEGISQMIATFDIYIASQGKVNGEIDFYSVLGLKPSSDRSMVKKQYKILAVLLHPDKNRTVGADGAFRLVSEAWTFLSDKAKKKSYDQKRNVQLSSTVVVGASFPEHSGMSSVPPTFWTVCTSCQVQYEYLRKYVNKRLSCKNCRGTFMAVELGIAPINGASYPVSPTQWSFTPENGYDNVTFPPGSTVIVSGNGIPGHHSGHGSEYTSNVSFQWSTSQVTPDSNVTRNGYGNKPGRKPKAELNLNVNGGQTYVNKVKRPYKRRKVEIGGPDVNGINLGGKVVIEPVHSYENGCGGPKLSASNESLIRQPILPPLDMRALLIEKGRKSVLKKLEEIKLVEAAKVQHRFSEGDKFGETRKSPNTESNKFAPVTLTVPDSDFHDFDKDRTEECFQQKQIWALYDEEDGMPRLYCIIRQIFSLKPFKIHISYLGSKTDTEFGQVNWLDSGFTKSCGHFRATHSDIVEEVNMFSHPLPKEKAGRGGCVRIFPRSGDIWAVYRNWSKDWNRSTPYDERHQYEMVEILNDYCEDYGVSVTPLVKVQGFKTVYRRKTDKGAVQWVPRREMVRFSHPVPCWLLKDVDGLPEGCWDLDPAATPDDLLQPVNGLEGEEKLRHLNT